MRRALPLVALLTACATTRPDATWLSPEDASEVTITSAARTPVRRVTDRAEVARLVSCLRQAEPVPDGTPPPAWTNHLGFRGREWTSGHWLYSAETGEIGKLSMQVRPRGRLTAEARACVAPFLAPTP